MGNGALYMEQDQCGCGGYFIFQEEIYDSYFDCIVNKYKCNKCGYIWHEILE